MSLLLPSFLARLADPLVNTVLLCGCGGGFDFVHAMLLYPELMRLGKQVVVGSYSFGHPASIQDAETVFQRGDAVVKRVTAKSVPPPHYGPEVHLCSFLDTEYPQHAPHAIYAYYARAFAVPALRELYQGWVHDHGVDAVVLVDGGSDSLMAGDEEGLGDPVEDAVSVATVATLEGLRTRILLTVGFGSDRFNHVSDAASLRAVAELTRLGGYLGAVAVEPGSDGFRVYQGALQFIEARQTFRSVLASNIATAVTGGFGPAGVKGRTRDGVFLWPLMAMLWGFDVECVARRSMTCEWIRECESPVECHAALDHHRRQLGAGRREVEELPVHAEWRCPR